MEPPRDPGPVGPTGGRCRAVNEPDLGAPAQSVASTLGAAVGFSGLAQVMPLFATFATTPFLLRTLGLDVFGVWSLLGALLGTLTILDGGVGASLSRFYTLHGGRGNKADVGRLVSGSLLLFVALGALITAVGYVSAPFLVRALTIPRGVRDDAVAALRCVGPLVTLALISDSAVSLLQATSRFRALAGVTFTSCAVYVLGVVLFVGSSRSLLMLVAVTALRYTVLLVGGFAAAAREFALQRPFVPGVAVRQEFRRYALRMQLSGVTFVVNGETDALVIGAVLPVRYVGLYMVGYQAATALRSLPLYAFPPILTQMTSVFARRGVAGAAGEFHRLQARWLPMVLGYGAVATSAVGFGVEAWLGPGYGTSSVVAILLTAGYMVQVATTGMRTCFVRSVGRPGLETRYSLGAMALNLVLTIPFAVLFGAVGVVAATTAGLVVGSLYFVRLCGRVADLHDQFVSPRWVLAVGLAVTVTIAGELLVRRTGMHGMLALLVSGGPALVGLTIVAVHQFGLRLPRVRRLRS